MTTAAQRIAQSYKEAFEDNLWKNIRKALDQHVEAAMQEASPGRDWRLTFFGGPVNSMQTGGKFMGPDGDALTVDAKLTPKFEVEAVVSYLADARDFTGTKAKAKWDAYSSSSAAARELSRAIDRVWPG